MDQIHINTLVGIRSAIIRSSTIIPDVQTAFFSCQSWNNVVESKERTYVINL